MQLENAYSLVGLAPGLLWLLFLKMRARPELFACAVRVFLLGAAFTVPASVIESLLGASPDHESFGHAVVTSFLVIGPVEETAKLLAVWVGVYRHREFRDRLDGLMFATTAALGFAGVENVLALNLVAPELAVFRFLYATPAHVMFACMWGYSLGLARFQRQGEIIAVFKGLLASIVLHGAYDSIAATDTWWGLAGLTPFMLLLAWLTIARIRALKRSYPFPHREEGALIICPTCGAYTPAEVKQCQRCESAIPDLEVDAPRVCGRCRAVLDPCAEACTRCGEPISLARLCTPPAAPQQGMFGFLR